jgi:hypothetical protein
MEIRHQSSQNYVPFKLIDLGAVFLMEGTYYMKTQPTDSYNAVSLQDGELHYIYSDMDVQQVSCCLVIE